MMLHLVWEYGLQAWIAGCVVGLIVIACVCVADVLREHKHGERL